MGPVISLREVCRLSALRADRTAEKSCDVTLLANGVKGRIFAMRARESFEAKEDRWPFDINYVTICHRPEFAPSGKSVFEAQPCLVSVLLYPQCSRVGYFSSMMGPQIVMKNSPSHNCLKAFYWSS
jgi:hypothetical protein